MMDTWIYVAGWTLVHFVWQGAVIAAGAALGFSLLRRATANVRYMLASAALVLMLVSLVVTAGLISAPATTIIAAPSSTPFSISAARTPFADPFPPQRVDMRATVGAATALRALPHLFPAIVLMWLSGVAILLVRLLRGWRRVHALQRRALTAPPSPWQLATDRLARRLGVRRRVRVVDEDVVETPTVLGWWRPVIILPLSALSGLTPSQADAILAHELAHIRRHDYLVNLFQHVAETVLFYHPAVWWLSHRMRVEREQCCDEIVVNACADALDYAAALTHLEEARLTDTALGVTATGGRLLTRIRRLLGPTTDQRPTIVHALVTITIIAIVIVIVGGGYRSSLSRLHANGRNEPRIHAATASVPVSATIEPEPIAHAKLDPVLNSHPITDSAFVEAIVPVTRVDAIHVDLPHHDAIDALQNPAAEIGIGAEVNYFQLNRAEYFVPVTMTVPGTELGLARARGATRTSIEFIGEIKDEFGTPIANVHDKMDIPLSDDAVAQFATRPIQYETSFILLPGRYRIRIMARDAETDRSGTFEMAFIIPNLNREEQRVPISTVVLGSQLVQFNEDAGKNPASNPLVSNGLKLIPSVSRVFSKTQDMYVFLQAYERDATTIRPLVASVTLYRGDVKALETPTLRVADVVDARSKAVPFRFAVPLSRLEPGNYECEVIVLDPEGQKVTSWRAPVVIVP
jgi:beta-lactamase regulating signal transducer with metallopeptidase domain